MSTYEERAQIAETQLSLANKRIKKLEVELASMAQGMKISIPTQTMEQEFQNHYRRGYEAGQAVLRQRIDDAPVVAWQAQSGFCYPSKRFNSDKPLISKEDLLK